MVDQLHINYSLRQRAPGWVLFALGHVHCIGVGRGPKQQNHMSSGETDGHRGKKQSSHHRRPQRHFQAVMTFCFPCAHMLLHSSCAFAVLAYAPTGIHHPRPARPPGFHLFAVTPEQTTAPSGLLPMLNASPPPFAGCSTCQMPTSSKPLP